MAGLRSRSLRRELRTPLAATQPEDARRRRAAGRRPSAADRIAPGLAGRGQRSVADPGRAHDRPVDRRVDSPDSAVRAARPVRCHARRLAGESHGRGGPDHGGGHRTRLPAGADGTADGVADQARTHGAAAAHRRAAARLRRGVVLLGRLDRRAAGGAGPAGRDHPAVRCPGRVDCSRGARSAASPCRPVR